MQIVVKNTTSVIFLTLAQKNRLLFSSGFSFVIRHLTFDKLNIIKINICKSGNRRAGFFVSLVKIRLFFVIFLVSF